MIAIALPFPPSINRYLRATVRNGRPAKLLSKQGREFRSSVILAARCHGVASMMIMCPVAVRLDLFPPDLRRRDVDNFAKAVLDALTHAAVWEDDRQVDDLRITRKAVDRENPRVEVFIEELVANA